LPHLYGHVVCAEQKIRGNIKPTWLFGGHKKHVIPSSRRILGFAIAEDFIGLS
jgi:hypothetical protein